MLKFSGLESNVCCILQSFVLISPFFLQPARGVISSGIRHLSKNVEILAECPAWTIPDVNAQVRISKLKDLDTSPAWSQAPGDYHPVRLVFDDHVKKRFAETIREEDFWLDVSSQPERLQLEHVFECRFAGPLIMACTKNLQGDDTTEDALILLDRIINNPLNLAWAPTSLNSNKTSFFGGSFQCPFNAQIDFSRLGTGLKYEMTIKQDKAEVIGTFTYLNAMAPAFKTLIETIVNCCIDQYPKDSVIVRMLKVLYQSPFCQGNWEHAITPVGTQIRWSI
jgi:hypothetical protein